MAAEPLGVPTARYGCPMHENLLKRGIHLPVLEDIGIFQGYNP